MSRETGNRFSLFDRLALGFLNLLVSLPTGVVLWAVLNGFPWAVNPWLPASSIIWFTAIMTLAGMVTNSTLLIDFFAWVWKLLAKWLEFSR